MLFVWCVFVKWTSDECEVYHRETLSHHGNCASLTIRDNQWYKSLPICRVSTSLQSGRTQILDASSCMRSHKASVSRSGAWEWIVWFDLDFLACIVLGDGDPKMFPHDFLLEVWWLIQDLIRIVTWPMQLGCNVSYKYIAQPKLK